MKTKEIKWFWIITITALILLPALVSAVSLDDLEDVTIGILYDNQFLRYDTASSNWTNENVSIGSDGYAGDTGHPHNQDLNSTSAVTFSTVDTGFGANELYDMNQNVRTLDAVTFLTVNTGFGANELYDMDQNVLTSSNVQFEEVEIDGGTGNAYLKLVPDNHDLAGMYWYSDDKAQYWRYYLDDDTMGNLKLDYYDGSTTYSLLYPTLVAGLPNFVALGVGDTSPAYRLELPNIASVEGRGRADAWTTYSDNRTKDFDIDFDDICLVLDCIDIKPYKSIESGEIRFGVDAQDLYFKLKSFNVDDGFIDALIYRPVDERVDFWSVDYNLLCMTLLHGFDSKPVIDLNYLDYDYVWDGELGQHRYIFIVNVSVYDLDYDDLKVNFYWKLKLDDNWISHKLMFGSSGFFDCSKTLYVKNDHVEVKTIFWLIEVWDGNNMVYEEYDFSIVRSVN